MLFNPKSPKQKVAKQQVAGGKISGLWGVDKWHDSIIPNLFVKVDISIVHVVEVPLMVTNEVANQLTMRNAIGLSTLWNWKYVKDFV